NYRGDNRAGQFMDDLSKAGIFLRGPADHREGPNSAVAMVYFVDPENRKRVGQTVISQVIAERSFRKLQGRIYRSGNTKIRLCGDGEESRMTDQGKPAATQGAGKSHFRKTFRKGHYGGQHQGRGAPDEHIDAKRHAYPKRLRVMHANAPVDL